ncbi:hypothetical protein MBT84_02320 [Streptomyces sp. MBT84]|nr:hypothetical protein [Streptomyces sp. MBT84]
MTMPTAEKKPVTTANPDNGIVSPPSGTWKSTPTAWASAAARVVATIAPSVATKPKPASLRSRWVRLVRPVAVPATTSVSFMLFMSFLHHSVSGVRGVDWHVTVLVLGVTMHTLAVRWPAFRRAWTPVPRSRNPASRPKSGPGSPSCGSTCTRPRVTTPSASQHSAATTAARATAQRERPYRDYSVPSAGRRSGSPSRGNWSSWNVTISVIAPPVTRRTSIVSGRYAPSRFRQR